ncbi:hypothetical protein EX30DRAFT_343838 [Ascodesmis nigricans]|uniref:Uncharacterized protein n=1 Tax=Ascodesmis nigricans TaxID=341454 RepID=A0A4S2ML46_9PEZI|nr:hypothetical protein EX30DRAFT_343838 [Ascodesmis nigricans]
MFCLRSWLPLLFIPTSASPAFIVLFLISTYLFHRPCVYCSVIMLTLFSSSCYWSDRCFLDSNNGHWFEPRILPMGGSGESGVVPWTGLGLGWVRALLGRREWDIRCLDVNIRL